MYTFILALPLLVSLELNAQSFYHAQPQYQPITYSHRPVYQQPVYPAPTPVYISSPPPSTAMEPVLLLMMMNTFRESVAVPDCPNTEEVIKTSCKAGYTYFSHTGQCYKYVSGNKAWTEANAVCRADGGNLASVHDIETNDFLTTLTQVYTWIGGFRLVDDQNVWGWTDGSGWDYSNWGAGYPNNAGGNQDYVGINWGLGLWDDEDNLDTINQGYICQQSTAWQTSGVLYVKVFQHFTAGGLFPTIEDALRMNPGNPKAQLFSILDQLESFRSSDGKFRFRLCYPELNNDKKCNEWIQTSNPANEAIITGFEAVDLAFTTNGQGNTWKGLGKNNQANNANAFIDDAPTQSAWWTAIGAIQNNPNGQTTIPGPTPQMVTVVELYVKKI